MNERVSHELSDANITEWIHCFNSVNCVMFFVSLVEYAEMCYEDDRTNRLDESLQLFDYIVHSQWFKDIPVILVFNKADMMPETLSAVPLNQVRNDFSGRQRTCIDAIRYLTDLYMKMYRGNESNKIYPIMLSAVDKGLAEKAFTVMKKVVIGSGIENYKFVINKHPQFLDVVIKTHIISVQEEVEMIVDPVENVICDQVRSYKDDSSPVAIMEEPVPVIKDVAATPVLSIEEIQYQETVKLKSRTELHRLVALLNQKEQK
jgi:hypothetical protein